MAQRPASRSQSCSVKAEQLSIPPKSAVRPEGVASISDISVSSRPDASVSPRSSNKIATDSNSDTGGNQLSTDPVSIQTANSVVVRHRHNSIPPQVNGQGRLYAD